MRAYHQRARPAPRANPGGRPPAAELELRKARVMAIAADLFVDHGYVATSLNDIGDAAGVSAPLIYRHFGDKEALFRTAILARTHELVTVPPRLPDGETLVTALHRLARATEALLLNPRAADLMRLLISESQRFPEFTRDCAGGLFDAFRGRLADAFADLASRGIASAFAPALLADLFSSMILGGRPIMALTHWMPIPRADADIDVRIDLFMRAAFEPAVVRVAHTCRLADGATQSLQA